MIKDVCAVISQNKNALMLISVTFYILALFSVLSGHSFAFSTFVTAALYHYTNTLYLLNSVVLK